MTDYTSFFLDASSGVVPLECIEIDHPSFEAPFRYVRNDVDGMIAQSEFYAYQPMSIKRNNVSNDLEQTVSITFADMDDDLINAIKAIRSSGQHFVRPTFILKIFRDDDLTAPMLTLQTLEIVDVSKDATGLVTFDAQAPELNSVKTGRTYTLEEYPLLKGA